MERFLPLYTNMTSIRIPYQPLARQIGSRFNPIKLIGSVKRIFPWLYDLALSPKRDKFIGLRRLISFPFGLATGYIFYSLCITRLDFPPELEETLLPVTLLLYTIAYCVSVQFRTITWLLIPFFASAMGRSYLFISFFALSATGPTSNLLGNTFESGRSLVCTVIFHRNVTADKARFIYEPYLSIFKGLQTNSHTLKEQVKNLRKGINAIRNAVDSERDEDKLAETIKETDLKIGDENRVVAINEDFKENIKHDESASKSRAKMARKMDFACEALVSQGVLTCSKYVTKLKETCFSNLPRIINWFCYIIKVSWFCSIGAKAAVRACSGRKMVPQGFGSGVDQLDHGVNNIQDNLALDDIKYSISIPSDYANFSNPIAIEAELASDFKEKIIILSTILSLLSRFSAMIFLFTLFRANMYHNGYLRRIDYDNKFVTSYFRKIDARRVAEGRMHLLPLRKLEKLELFNPTSIKLNPEEKRIRLSALLVFLPVFLGIMTLCFYDYLFHEILSSIEKFFYLKRVTKGIQYLRFEVTGESGFASFLRNVFSRIGMNYSIDSVLTNERCLPYPEKTSNFTYMLILSFAGLIIFYLCIQAYIVRCRRLICAYFYPRREKSRIIFLYNDYLKKRKLYTLYQLRKLKETVAKNAHNRDQVFSNLVHKFAWLKWLKPWFKRYCSICETVLDSGSYQCPRCEVIFCSQCWELVKKVCRACSATIDTGDIGFSDDEKV